MDEIDLSDIEKELSSQGFAVRDGNLPILSYSSIRHRKWRPAPQKSGVPIPTLRQWTRNRHRPEP